MANTRIAQVSRLTCIVLTTLASLAADAQDQAAQLDHKLLEGEMRVEPTGPAIAGFPLLVNLHITNVGEQPLTFWSGGHHYPSVRNFSAIVTDQNGFTRLLHIYNGAYFQGSGVDRRVERLETIDMPVACDLLPSGVYSVVISCPADGYVRNGEFVAIWPAMTSNAMSIVVREEPQQLRQARDELLTRAIDDRFADRVCWRYGFHKDVRRWMEQLGSPDTKKVQEAMGWLQHLRAPPLDCQGLLIQATRSMLSREIGVMEGNMLAYFAKIARRIGNEEGLDATMLIATSDIAITPGEERFALLGRYEAITQLARFAQPRAVQALLAMAGDANDPASSAAAAALAERGHPLGVEHLLKRAADANPHVRAGALIALGGMRSDPRVRAVLDEATRDPEFLVRHCAERSLNVDPVFADDSE